MHHRGAFAPAILAAAFGVPAASAADFSISVPGGAMTTVRNASAATVVQTAVAGGFDAAIALSASGLPAGVTATFAPATIAAPGAGGATLKVAAGAAAPVGVHTVTVTGSGGGLVRSATVSLTIASTTTTILSTDFEGTFPGSWQVVHLGSNAWWGPSTYRSFAGGKSLYCAASGSSAPPAGGTYPANMNSWVIYGPFSLVGASAAQATFRFWLNSQPTYDKFQFMWSTSFNTGYKGFTKTGASSGWETGTLDFNDPLFPTSGLGKPNVYFAFIFSSNASTQAEGAYVDSLSITKTMASTPCVVTCTAAAPAAAVAGLPAVFAGTINASSCSGSPSLAWTFGDGTPGSTSPSASHAYGGAGTFPWQMTASMGGQSCVGNGSVVVTSPCTLSCSATVPAAGNTRAPVAFHAEATASNCGASPAFDWDFGDGTHAATADAAHQYVTMGPKSWTLTVVAGSETCTRAGTVAIGKPIRRGLTRLP
jgi:PKD repeat protein